MRAWWLAARPYSLTIILCPVVSAGALAWLETGQWHGMRWLLTLCAALCIQIATNLLNDVGDFERGTDLPERLGPPRATANGWLAPQAVRRAGLTALAVAFVLGIGLAWMGGWPIVLLGLVSLLCGWAYTAGPKPIAYGPLGEVCVWLFFGLAATVGTYWLQTGRTSGPVWLLGHMMGAFAAAVMLVNNVRDAATDARAGKRTLAVRMGLRASRGVYAVLVLVPFVLLAGMPHRASWPWALAPWLALPMALWLVWQFARAVPGRGHNHLLALTARLQLVFTGWWLVAELLLT